MAQKVDIPPGSKIVNLHDAKATLSELVKDALAGREVVIARYVKAQVRLVPVEAATPPRRRRLGFLAGMFEVPDAPTFNALGREEIESVFSGDA
jgi:antitoxin (DNA-binding transcriptional repressor) of toxin-antitoxin stability system